MTRVLTVATGLFLTAFLAASAEAAPPTGKYEFTGKQGVAFLRLHEGGDFSGKGAFKSFGVVDISGTLATDERADIDDRDDGRRVAALRGHGRLGTPMDSSSGDGSSA